MRGVSLPNFTYPHIAIYLLENELYYSGETLTTVFFTAKAAFKRLIGECGARSPQLLFGVLCYFVSTIAANTIIATAIKSNRFCFIVFRSNCLSVINRLVCLVNQQSSL